MDKHSADGSPHPAGLPTFDCFLSHNSKDKPAARVLAKRLRGRGISIWFDQDQLRPGGLTQPELESGIAASRCVAVLVGADGLGPWQALEGQFAVALAIRDQRAVIPVLLPDAPTELKDQTDPTWPGFLAIRTYVDLRPSADTGDMDGLDRLIWGITGIKPDARRVGDADATPCASEPCADTAPAASPHGPGARADVRSAAAEAATPIHDDAVAAIAAALRRQPDLRSALSGQAALRDATEPMEIAKRLCARETDGFRDALAALRAALPPAAVQNRRRQGELSLLQSEAHHVLGWMAVTAVMAGYAREEAVLVKQWFDGAAFHIPLGRDACLEVLTARWWDRPAEFGLDQGRWESSPHDLVPKGEIAFGDSLLLDANLAVEYIWRLIYQHIEGRQAPAKLYPDDIDSLAYSLNIQLREKGRRRRLVIDGRGQDAPFNFPSILAAIHARIPQIHLFVLVGQAAETGSIFLLPASEFAANIRECLREIRALDQAGQGSVAPAPR